jgi:hypothetical protein
MSEVSAIPSKRVLDPMERISETMLGLIMALTFTCTLGVATDGNAKHRGSPSNGRRQRAEARRL